MTTFIKTLIVIYSVILYSSLGLGARNELVATADCVCPGETFVYECSIVGAIFTVWRGSVISAGCEITLIHSEFTTGNGARAVCNNGDVVGQSVDVLNDCYTSQLSIEVNSGVNGSTVECIRDDGVTATVIATSTLLISTIPFPPPTNVKLTHVEPGRLTFTWTPPQMKCPLLTYNVITNNCGFCVNNSAVANTICTNFTLSDTCSLTIRSIICGNLASVTDSNEVTVALNVPDSLGISESISYYSDSDRRLLRISTTWNTAETFMISDGINGSTLSYTVVYSDLITNRICDRAVLNPTMCKDRLCTHLFNTITSECSTTADLAISIFATNILGEGPPTTVFHVGTNTFVNVNFNTDKTAVACEFVNEPLESVTGCTVNITYGTNCNERLSAYVSEPDAETGQLTTPKIDLVDGVSEYCFAATATFGDNTVIIEGTFNLFQVNNPGVTTAAVIVPLVLIVTLIAAVVIVILLWRKYKTKLVIIHFTNLDKPGSLAQMLKVFKDNGVNIISINKVATPDDIKRKFFRKRTFMTETFVIVSCTDSVKRELESQNLSYLQTIDYKGNATVNGEDVDSQLKYEWKLLLQVGDSPGSLWRIIQTFAGRDINIVGLNTRSNFSKTAGPGLKYNYVYCRCSTSTRNKVIRSLRDAGGLDVDFKVYAEPSVRTLQFFVRDEPGALAKALAVFRDEHINIMGINPEFLRSHGHDTFLPGHMTIYIECDIDENKRKELDQRLPTNDAADIEVTKHRDHNVVKLSVVDKVGSLVSTLEAFKDVDINILGVNAIDVGPSTELRPTLNIEYKRVHISLTSLKSSFDMQDVIKDLESTGYITDPKWTLPERDGKYMIEFLGRDGAHALKQAFDVFNNHSLSVANLTQEDEPHDVVYVHNHVRFLATDEQEAEVIRKLYTTGFVVSVHRFEWNEKRRQAMAAKLSSQWDECSVDTDPQQESKV